MLDVRHADWNRPGTPCVSVLESPAPRDLLRECQEGRALQTALHQARIPCRYYLAANKDAFRESLGFIAKQRHQDKQQIALHISCHGNDDGIELTSGEFIKWLELGPMLVAFARDALAYHEKANLSSVILCMSSCSGLAAAQMGRHQERPFMSLVAPNQSISWSDCLVSFLTFYNLFLIKDSTIGEAVTAMNSAAASENTFQVLDYSDDLKRAVEQEDAGE